MTQPPTKLVAKNLRLQAGLSCICLLKRYTWNVISSFLSLIFIIRSTKSITIVLAPTTMRFLLWFCDSTTITAKKHIRTRLVRTLPRFSYGCVTKEQVFSKFPALSHIPHIRSTLVSASQLETQPDRLLQFLHYGLICTPCCSMSPKFFIKPIY